MKNLLFVRIPSACICFTIIILAGTLSNLFNGTKAWPFPLYLFGWILVCEGIDWLISLIDFKSWLWYCVTESLILYVVSLAVALMLHWISWEPVSVLIFTLIFGVADSFIFWYFWRRGKLLAEEINTLLHENTRR